MRRIRRWARILSGVRIAVRLLPPSRMSIIDLASWLGSLGRLGVLIGHLPSAILILPKPVSRSPPETSSI
jgi:hypothetical protein